MILKLNMASDTPIYEQIRNQIIIGIGKGELQIGEGLPTVRQMADDIGVNMMTVNKAYSILKNEGYIEIDRRHGAKICQAPCMDNEFQEKLKKNLLLFISEAKLRGMNKQTFFDYCESLFQSMNC